ncbi:uncharacterized protein LOC134848491 [Symsagittifera roscoffensis]|uniref:uncharacterized protein LOC134848491 n=1 Tax=Symsagittifera roscoffensis TaxID=84072 RepID=UPI00307BA09C
MLLKNLMASPSCVVNVPKSSTGAVYSIANPSVGKPTAAIPAGGAKAYINASVRMTSPASNSGNYSSSMTSSSSAASSTRQKGCIQVGFYDIDRTIGKGNFATVKLARHRVTKSRVALKIINKKQLDESDLAKTYREINILKKLNHVNIVRLYQVMVSNNMLYLVTEHAANGELFEFLAEHGRMEEPEAQRIFWQIVLAVEYCHQQGVVHRDLKVENLLFDSFWDIKIADFGFSNTYVPGKLLDTWCGSPPYAAPEIFQGLNYNGEKLDIWSMGVILYVLVCGCLPFDGDSLQELRSRVLSGRYRIPYFLSRNCESLIQRILVLDPVKRYTVQQIKQHIWMKRDSEYDIYNGCGATSTRGGDLLPLNENVLQAMNRLGLDQEKTNTSVVEQKYDHFHAIYHLLLEKVETSGPISLNVKQPSQMPNLSSSSDSVSVCSSISLDQKSAESTTDKGLLRQKSCSPKGSIGTPSIDEGFSSDVSFDADQSLGKEASMEQMTPIKEDPEAEHLRLNSTTGSSVASTPRNSANNTAASQLDFEISWQSHHFSHLKIPNHVSPPSMIITTDNNLNQAQVATATVSTGSSSGAYTSLSSSTAVTTGGQTTHFHNSYDEVSGEKMLVNLGGHSNFSSLESQCSEYSSNISLDTSQQQLHNSTGGTGNRFTQSTSLSPQVCVARPPLVHQQRIGDCFSSTNAANNATVGFLACGRRASESNLNEQDQEELEPNPKNMKHQVQPYTIQTLSHFEATAVADKKPTDAKYLTPNAKLMVSSSPANSNTLNVAIVNSAPGSPSVQAKRLIKQQPMNPKLGNGDLGLKSRMRHPINLAGHSPPLLQQPVGGHSPTQFLSPLAISNENFNKPSQYHMSNSQQQIQLQHQAQYQNQILQSQSGQGQLGHPLNSGQALLPSGGTAATGGYTFIGTPRFALLPKPRSFDETQSHRRSEGMTSSSGNVTGSGLSLAASDACRRQHSFDTPSKLHNQSSNEEPTAGDEFCPTLTNAALLATSSCAAVKERMLKNQRRLYSSSPYAVKQPAANQPRSPSARAFPRRDNFQRQLTLRPQKMLERQSSKCSSSPPRVPLAHHSSLDNEYSTANQTMEGVLSQSLALSPGVSSSNVGNSEITCMLQQMELRNSINSPLPAAESRNNPSPVEPHLVTNAPQRFQGVPNNSPTPVYRYPHNNAASAPRHQVSSPIPSISFESADGIVCYLNSANVRPRSPTNLAASPSTHSLGSTDDRVASPSLQNQLAQQLYQQSLSGVSLQQITRDQLLSQFSQSQPNPSVSTIADHGAVKSSCNVADGTYLNLRIDSQTTQSSEGLKQDQLSEVPIEFMQQMNYVAVATANVTLETRTMTSRRNSDEASQNSSPMDQE